MPKFGRGRDANLGKCWENVKIISFFDISNKMKDNFWSRMCKRGLYPSRAKLEQLLLIFLENDSFFQF